VLNSLIIVIGLSLVAVSLPSYGLNDPTKPAVKVVVRDGQATAKIKKEKLVLHSIKVSQGNHIAIINQQAYRVGQAVGEEKIKQILSNKVVFASGNSLSLFGESLIRFSTKD